VVWNVQTTTDKETKIYEDTDAGMASVRELRTFVWEYSFAISNEH
jgi:hypothetical protein